MLVNSHCLNPLAPCGEKCGSGEHYSQPSLLSDEVAVTLAKELVQVCVSHTLKLVATAL